MEHSINSMAKQQKMIQVTDTNKKVEKGVLHWTLLFLMVWVFMTISTVQT